jgi:hypothetical protein
MAMPGDGVGDEDCGHHKQLVGHGDVVVDER